MVCTLQNSYSKFGLASVLFLKITAVFGLELLWIQCHLKIVVLLWKWCVSVIWCTPSIISFTKWRSVQYSGDSCTGYVFGWLLCCLSAQSVSLLFAYLLQSSPEICGCLHKHLDETTDIKTIDSGFSKNSEAQNMPRSSPHTHDKYLIYFELQASLIWFAQRKVVRLQLHDIKVHDMQF